MIKNKFFVGAFIGALAIFGSFSMKVEATTVGSDTTMNPPALGVVIKGCEVPGAVYSPVTGESCSTNGVAITPPIAFFPPYTADGCGPVGPYSISTGKKCVGLVPMPPVSIDGCKEGSAFSTVTGVKCTSITPMPPVKNDDCIYNKNCTTSTIDGCKDGTAYSTTTGYKCMGTGLILTPKSIYDQIPIAKLPPVTNCDVAKNKDCGSIDSTHPIFSSVKKIVKGSSSTDDVKALQAALNKALKTSLKSALSEDGKWGQKTTDAVKMFQAWAKISVDGKVGPMTLEKMKASVE